MSIFINRSTRLLVQGITGRDGAFHTEQMIASGTQVVAGVTPGKGGTSVHGVPVYDGVAEAARVTGANASVIFVPAPHAINAIFEAVDAGIVMVVCITEGIPVNETLRAVAYANAKGCRIIGPNCPGLITPGAAKLGILPNHIFTPGSVGVISRSGTLTYEIVQQLTQAGIGQSTCIGIGGDPVVGTGFVDCLRAFADDPDTKAVVMVGEIGGSDEQDAAAFIHGSFDKPVVAFIAGKTAPADKRMGHAGAIVSASSGSAAEKERALADAGVAIAPTPAQIPDLISTYLPR